MGTSGILLTGRMHMLPVLGPPVLEGHSLPLYLLSDSERLQRVLQTDPLATFTTLHLPCLFCSSLSSRTHYAIRTLQSHFLQGSQNNISDPGQVAVSMLLSLYSQPLSPPGSRSEEYTRSYRPLHPAFPAPPSKPLPPTPTVGLPNSPWPFPAPRLQAAPFPPSFLRLGNPPKLL